MYAPVSTLSLQAAGDCLIGHAAPSGGPAPCLLRLTADDSPIAAARATRFSPSAREAAIRLGWCGVRLPGLAAATAVGTDLKVRCGVTDRVLWSHKARAPIAGPQVQAAPLTVFDILAMSRAEDGSPGLTEILPFMRDHLQRLGAASFINASFETFFGRSAEKPAIDSLAASGGDLCDTVLSAILTSAEYKNRKQSGIPGPFSAAFRYSLDGLDAKRA